MIDKYKNIIYIALLFAAVVIFLVLSANRMLKPKTPLLLQKNIGKIESTCLDMYNSLQFDEAADCYKQLMTLEDSPRLAYNVAISLGYAKDYKQSVDILQDLRERKDISVELRKNVEFAYIEFVNHKNKADFYKQNDKGNYIGDLTRTAKWKNPKNIRVYIYNDYDKYDDIKNAFLKWDNALRSTVNFSFINNPKNADIIVKAVEYGYFSNGEAGETKLQYDLQASNRNNRRKILKASIKISYKNSSGKPWNDAEFQSIALHEIGHVLGIVDHSKHKGDIMYYDTSSYQKGTVSNRDVNTVKILYGNIAN